MDQSLHQIMNSVSRIASKDAMRLTRAEKARTMNAPLVAYSFILGEPSRFGELASVRVLREVVTDEGAAVPAGSRGTVVSTYAGGAAYEVEFECGTVTVEADFLTAA